MNVLFKPAHAVLGRAPLSAKIGIISLLLIASLALPVLVSAPAAAGATLLALYLLAAIGSELSSGMRSVQAAAKRLASGDYDSSVDTGVIGEAAELLAALDGMRGSLKERTEESARFISDAARIRQGLDVVETNVMVADADLNIVYVNRSILKMLKAAEDEIRKDLPAFNADRLIGQNIDLFHKNPAHQRHLLAELDRQYTTRLNIGNRSFSLVLNPIKQSGGHLGTVVEWKDITKQLVQDALNADYHGQLTAISRSQAVIEFTMDGHVLTANDNFLKAMGYSLDEIKGKHHSLFVDPVEAASPEYHEMWQTLGRGEYVAKQYRRITKEGHDVWLQSSYNAILDVNGRPVKVVKFGQDITEQMRESLALVAAVKEVDVVVAKARQGDMTQRIAEDDKNGSIRTLVEGINQVLASNDGVLTDIRTTLDAIGEGKLETRARAELHQGGFRTMVQSINESLDAVIKPLNVAAHYVDRISKGDIPPKITDSYKGDFNTIKSNLNTCVDVVNALVADADMLAKAAVEGRLATRADATKHEGDFRKIVQGVNDTLDAVIGPLNVAANYVDRISKGDIPPAITDNYNGDFNTIKNNLNRAIDAVNKMVDDAGILAKAAVEGRLATRADATQHEGDFRKIVQGVNDTLDAVIGPLNVAANYVDRISKGDIPPAITDSYNGDFNTIKNNLNRAIDAVNKMVDDAGILAKAAVEGRLATRADATKHEGDFRKIVQGVNETLDAVIGPLNVAANYVDRISKGDIPPAITDSYNGDFNTIKNNLNRAIDAVNKMVDDAGILAKAAVEGRLATRADASKHEGDFRKIVQGVNDTLDAVIGPLNVAANYVDRISKGDIPPEITDSYNGDFNTIKNNLNRAIDAVNKMVDDAGILAKAAVEGRLATRADASKHEGDFRKIVQGVNDTLDAVIGPLNVAANYVDRISKGDIPPAITDSYNGDFNTIKNNLNQAIDAVNKLVADAGMLSTAAVEGKLATRADATKHQGDFRKIVQGVNETLDAVIGPLNVAANYVDRISKGDIPPVITDSYNGDFNTIKNNLNQAIVAVNKLVADAGMLSTAAVEGKLATRADASKHQGDFRKIVQGVNETLDAVIGPLGVAADVVDRIARGDIPPPITDSYNGDFNNIKNNLNTCISAVNTLVADADMLSTAAVEGKLATRADTSKHQGDFRKIVQGVNETLDAVIAPINETGRVLSALAQGDLTETIRSNYRGDFDKMVQDTNRTVVQLSQIVSSIQQATSSINLAAREIASGNVDLSSRTEQQAASLEETASSMEELTSTVRLNAENAKQANQLALGASDVARKGGMVVGEVVGTMSEIQASSKKIVDIISVIDGIAFQTNILALNAAVEAARAGEQGRGFAVVAAEVRSLAQRSAAAAKEIKTLIGDSVEKVGNGSRLVEQAGRTMEEIVSSVKRVTDIMGEISAASQEQSLGIEQVNKTVTQMDEVTQQNAALVEEASASAQMLETQADGLAQAVAKFRLEAVDRTADAAAPPMQSATLVKLPTKPRAVPTGKKLAVAPRAASAAAAAATAPAAAANGAPGEQWAEF